MSKRVKISDADMTDRIRTALRVKYADAKRYVLLEEVGESTGFANGGWADAVCLNLWPSEGLTLTGFEIKSSRSDWLRELANPSKHERIARFCDAWVIVAPKGMVNNSELLPGWGLWSYDADDDRLATVVPPARRKATKYLHRRFFAALLRRTQGTMPAAGYVARIYAEARRDGARSSAHVVQTQNRTIDTLQSQLDELRKAVGDAGYRLNWRGALEAKGAS